LLELFRSIWTLLNAMLSLTFLFQAWMLPQLGHFLVPALTRTVLPVFRLDFFLMQAATAQFRRDATFLRLGAS
jgi:hypothetical protein